MAGNFVHNDTNPQATIGREDRPWYAMYADDVYATDVHGDIEGTTGINDAIQDALDLKSPLASPEFTGTPTTPDAASGTADSQIANCRFVANAIASGGGTGTRALFSGLMSAVPTQALTGFSTWVNQGTAAVVEDINGLTIYDSTANSSSVVDYAMLVKSAPSTPYTITAMFSFLTTFNTNYPQMGFGWRDASTGKMHGFAWNAQNGAPYWIVGADRWSSYSAYVSADAQYYPVNWPFVWLQLYDDGTTVYFQMSANGNRFRTLYSVAKSSGYLGSTGYNQLWFGVNAQGATVLATMLSYAQV